jgi:hypothetical protein
VAFAHPSHRTKRSSVARFFLCKARAHLLLPPCLRARAPSALRGFASARPTVAASDRAVVILQCRAFGCAAALRSTRQLALEDMPMPENRSLAMQLLPVRQGGGMSPDGEIAFWSSASCSGPTLRAEDLCVAGDFGQLALRRAQTPARSQTRSVEASAFRTRAQRAPRPEQSEVLSLGTLDGLDQLMPRTDLSQSGRVPMGSRRVSATRALHWLRLTTECRPHAASARTVLPLDHEGTAM